MFLIILEPEIVSRKAQQKQTVWLKTQGVFVTGNDHHVMQFGGCKSNEMKVVHDPTNLPPQ